MHIAIDNAARPSHTGREPHFVRRMSMNTPTPATNSLVNQQEAIVALLDRAIAEPPLLARIAADPFGSLAAAGVRVTGTDLKTILGLPEATDQELVEVLRTRLAATPSASCGCGS